MDRAHGTVFWALAAAVVVVVLVAELVASAVVVVAVVEPVVVAAAAVHQAPFRVFGPWAFEVENGLEAPQVVLPYLDELQGVLQPRDAQ